MGVGPLCHPHRLPLCLNLDAILVHRLIQAEGKSPKRTTALTGGPSSVMAELPLPEKADRQSERQVDRQANRRRVRRCEEQETRPCTLEPLSVSRQACVVYISQQGHTVRHVSGPSQHKQMFSGYCCSASPVIVFLQGQPVGQGARLCCGKELWRDGKTECIINHGCSTQTVHLFSLCSMWLELQQYKWGSWVITIIRTKPVLTVKVSWHFKAVKVVNVQSGVGWYSQ